MAKRTLIMHRARNRGVVGVRGSGGTWFTTGPSINAGGQTAPSTFSITADNPAVYTPETDFRNVITVFENGAAVGAGISPTITSLDPTVATAVLEAPTTALGRSGVLITFVAPGKTIIRAEYNGAVLDMPFTSNLLENDAAWEMLPGETGPSTLILDGNEIYKTGAGPEEFIAMVGSLSNDMEASCVLPRVNAGVTDGYFPLCVRAQGNDTGIGVRTYNGNFELYQRVGGAWTALQQIPWAGQGPVNVRLRVVGTQVDWWIDSVQQPSAVTTITGQGYVAFYDRTTQNHRLTSSNHSFTVLAP